LVQGRGAEIDPQTLIGGDGARNTSARPDLEALNEACRTLARTTIDSLPLTPDLAASAPHPYFGALNAKGWIYFMALHRGLHRYQCESVIDAPGFPRSVSLQTQPREAYRPSERKTWLVEKAEGKKQAATRKGRSAGGKRQDAGSRGRSVKSSPAKRHTTSKKKTTTRSK
jgi:hypothetical protein